MAFRPLLRQRALPVLTTAVGASVLITFPRELHAEGPHSEDIHFNRKPIYDDAPVSIEKPAPPAASATSSTPAAPSLIPSLPPSTPSTPAEPTYRPTPTDRLAVQIGQARLALYNRAIRAEDAVNSALTETLRLEHSFTSTIRSLAPPKESNEKLLPGALYVLVSAMAGSIVTRNRNILLRATVPVAVGIGAAYAVLPLTMKNVGDLAWTYEERFPVVADTHLRTKARMTEIWETGKAHTAMTVGMVQDKVGETRSRMEDWVKKGK
ncbi:hypothetical protein GQ43DRAFT_480336 [Delitschia confertaspora ATCC 74209]|uniref:MICOS complex subunit n=1 Tax=Delitschia confertaspora ATCC 74209 TaxID=1513339 RepID=A0A9P4JLU3_9PLEO|nr:hypothetical protein GQ43DRAFT_480336 [Delitschia confertaspora ATCC 74209]